MSGRAPHQSLSPMHIHTLHSLIMRKWLVHLSKSPTEMQGGARGLLQQLHSKLTQSLHPVILGDPPCGRPHLQTDTESSPLRTIHNTTLSHCVSCKNTHHCDDVNHILQSVFHHSYLLSVNVLLLATVDTAGGGGKAHH